MKFLDQDSSLYELEMKGKGTDNTDNQNTTQNEPPWLGIKSTAEFESFHIFSTRLS